MNIHRSYHLFTGKPQFNFLDSTPLNLTSEEEKFYFSIIDTLKIHRERISADVINEIESKSFNQENNLINDDEKINDNIKINNDVKSGPKNSKSSNLEDIKLNKEKDFQDNNLKEDKVLNRIENIKKAKIIKDEKKENITKQIANSKTNSNTTNLTSNNNNSDINSADVNNKNNFNNDAKSNNNKNFSKTKHDSTSKDSISENKHSNSSTKNILTKNKNIPSNDKNNKKTSQNPNNQFVDLENEEEIYLNKSKRKLKINDKIINETILLFEDMPSIMGVDTKIYGPFRSQDVAVLPVLNADIIVKNKKGRYLKI
jgi:DNA replication factor GINS